MGLMGPKHPTVRVRVRYMDARIDVILAPLIKTLWQYSIFTLNCCQENRPGIAWIQFQTPWDAANFLNVVTDLPTRRQLKTYQFWDTMYSRITREGQFGEWEYKCHLRNENEDIGKTLFNFAISIRFPLTDLPSIMKAFVDKQRVLERLR